MALSKLLDPKNELNQFNWSEAELIAYDEEVKRIRDNIAALDYQYDKGMEKGRAEEKIDIAKNLLLQNIDIDTVASATGISAPELEKLKKSI